MLMAKMLALSFLISSILTTTSLARAQQPTFEVASVKRAECALQNTIDPVTVALHGDPLKVVLIEAFKVKMDQIVGPSWLDSDCYAIDAKIPEGATKDELPAMFQALLVERFKLESHKETKLQPGYVLVVDKDGPKVSESDPSSPFMKGHTGQILFGAGPGASQIKGSMTMASLAHFVSGNLHVPVEDHTGLNGKFDIDVSWVPDRSIERMGPSAQEYADTHPDWADHLPADGPKDGIFTSFKKLGLRLESRKVPMDLIVIDHIEKIPTPN
jgi:uncharacterized protein (TIGR03435 family)